MLPVESTATPAFAPDTRVEITYCWARVGASLHNSNPLRIMSLYLISAYPLQGARDNEVRSRSSRRAAHDGAKRNDQNQGLKRSAISRQAQFRKIISRPRRRGEKKNCPMHDEPE